jgi:hypothetical protein
MMAQAHAAAQRTSAAPVALTPARAGLLQRKCACGGSAGFSGQCEDCGKKRIGVQRRAAGPAPGIAPPIVHEVLRSPGKPLDAATRAYMEPRFGHDFSQVRIYADADAARSAEAVSALAYTVGRNVVFGAGKYAPSSAMGRRLLAHELAHVMQQRSHDAETENSIQVEPTGKFAPSAAPRQRALMRLTPDEFRKKLGATPDEKTTIDALFTDATFNALWNYLDVCPSRPKKDLGPLSLDVEPGLKIGGVERFGGYFPGRKLLKINPTKPEHTANPQELIDTVVHELIHAVDDLDEDCVKAGAPESPLAGAGTVPSPRPTLANVKGTPDEDKLLQDLGPGASNPCEEFLDENKKAQQIVVSVIRSNIQTTHIGRPTLIFVNDALRNNPAALAEYKTCRDAACANTDMAARDAAIGKCSEAIIAKYVTAPKPIPTPAPAPGVSPPSPPPPKTPPQKKP